LNAALAASNNCITVKLGRSYKDEFGSFASALDETPLRPTLSYNYLGDACDGSFARSANGFWQVYSGGEYASMNCMGYVFGIKKHFSTARFCSQTVSIEYEDDV
jgi:hypothetical protein